MTILLSSSLGPSKLTELKNFKLDKNLDSTGGRSGYNSNSCFVTPHDHFVALAFINKSKRFKQGSTFHLHPKP